MTFPNYRHKHTKASLLNPQDIISYRRHLGRLPALDRLEGVLFCLERGLPKRMRWRIPVRKAGSMLGDLYQVKKAPQVGIMANFGGGAPITAELAEELIVLGARRLVLMTWGGALQPNLQPGDIVVCNRALRDDGTSHHYLPPDKYVAASHKLAQRLAEAIRSRGVEPQVGTTWTTDAPYRETLEEVQRYQEEQVQTVEMESAALFAIGQVRQVETASVVVIMDSLANFRWEVPDRLDRISQALETVYSAAIEVLSRPG